MLPIVANARTQVFDAGADLLQSTLVCHVVHNKYVQKAVGLVGCLESLPSFGLSSVMVCSVRNGDIRWRVVELKRGFMVSLEMKLNIAPYKRHNDLVEVGAGSIELHTVVIVEQEHDLHE